MTTTIPYTPEWYRRWDMILTVLRYLDMAGHAAALLLAVGMAAWDWPAWWWWATMAAVCLIHAAGLRAFDYVDEVMEATLAYLAGEMRKQGIEPPPRQSRRRR